MYFTFHLVIITKFLFYYYLYTFFLICCLLLMFYLQFSCCCCCCLIKFLMLKRRLWKSAAHIHNQLSRALCNDDDYEEQRQSPINGTNKQQSICWQLSKIKGESVIVRSLSLAKRSHNYICCVQCMFVIIFTQKPTNVKGNDRGRERACELQGAGKRALRC